MSGGRITPNTGDPRHVFEHRHDAPHGLEHVPHVEQSQRRRAKLRLAPAVAGTVQVVVVAVGVEPHKRIRPAHRTP
ncbi:TIGR03767 family metallophosphoesterase, partial [Streptomyces sp. NPDC127574]